LSDRHRTEHFGSGWSNNLTKPVIDVVDKNDF